MHSHNHAHTISISCVKRLCVTLQSNTIQTHSCTYAEKQSVVKPFYLTAVPKRLQSYLLLLYYQHALYFQRALTLGGLKG